MWIDFRASSWASPNAITSGGGRRMWMCGVSSSSIILHLSLTKRFVQQEPNVLSWNRSLRDGRSKCRNTECFTTDLNHAHLSAMMQGRYSAGEGASNLR